MAKIKIEDIIEPEVFAPYVIKKSVETSALLSSGIATPDDGIGSMLSKGGRSIVLPHWGDLSGSDEILSDTDALSVNKMDTFSDVACIHARGVAYAYNDLVPLVAGSNPAEPIAQKLGTKWATCTEAVLTNTLAGIFGTTEMADSVADKSTSVLTSDIMTDAAFLLGDHYKNLTAIGMHSAVYAKLKKLDLIDVQLPSALRDFDTYQNKRIVIDDSLTPTEGVYPVYFFGQGAVAFNENNELAEIEFDRDKLAGDNFIISRRVFTMHPRGVKWIGTAAGTTPTNAELATSTNWKLVDDRKNVAITKLLVKVA